MKSPFKFFISHRREGVLPPPYVPFLYRHLEGLAALVLLAAFTIFVACGIHGSSIGVIDQEACFAKTTSGYSYPTIGRPRSIRSDEWNVSTLQTLSQCNAARFFPRNNENIAGGADMFISTPCNPVWDWTAIGQFHNWGYFLFGAERGIAWSWSCRLFGIPLFAFLFFSKRMGDKILALVAAIAVSFGAPTVWWDTTLPFLLLYFFSTLYGIRLLFQPGRWPRKTAGAVLVTVSFLSFCLVGYPIFMVLLLPGLFALAWSEMRGHPSSSSPDEATPAGRRFSWALFTVVLGLIIIELLYFLHAHEEALEIVRHSAYPGARSFRGGDCIGLPGKCSYDVLSILGPFLPSHFFPCGGVSNVCTMARYFVPGLALFTGLLLAWRHLRTPRAEEFLLIIGIVYVVWGHFPWPSALAKLTGLSYIPPARCDVISGFFFLTYSFLFFAKNHANQFAAGRRLSILIASAAVFFSIYAILASGLAPVLLRSPRKISALFVVLVLVWMTEFGLMRTSRVSFGLGFLLLSICSGLTVHPLSIGLSPVYDKVFTQKVISLDDSEPGRWLANQSLTGNLVAATGVDCIPGTMAYAYPGYWDRIDPDGKYEKEWNRYAHAVVLIEPEGEFYAKAFRADALTYVLTEKEIRDLGIKHLVWTGKKLRLPWLRYDGRVHLNFFYTVLPVSQATP